MFIDFTKIEINAGNGGPGAISFRREKFISKGGPNGGDGGRGGHVFIIADANLNTLQDIRYKRLYKAENGKSGMGSNKTGRNGKDVKILVPPGSIIRSFKTKKIIIDLTTPNQEFMICEGGNGGKGNARYKPARRQAPRIAQSGLDGEHGIFEIELKLLADVGLVGLPNSGKSTLLSVLTSAKPKIADYPFTTIKPNLGIVKYNEYESFVMADIPGLIKGASMGKGLGHQFLKHIERNRIHIFLIDCKEENPNLIFETLKNELLSFNKALDKKPFLVCRTKIDLHHEESESWDKIDADVIDVSSISNQGLDLLVNSIIKILK